MRKTLIAAVALAPLCFMASAASATTTLSSARTTPIDTATAKAGAADDLTLDSGGSVTINTGGTTAVPVVEVKVDSSNVLANGGSIQATGANNIIGVQAIGGVTGSVGNVGAITLNSTYTAANNADGYPQGPLAGTASPSLPTGTGVYGLTGIQVTGTSAFNGAISNTSPGTITIKGNNSYGISIEAPITGGLFNSGTVAVTGDNSIAVRSTATSSIGGDASFSGAVTVGGVNSQGVSLQGDVGGRALINAAITSSGYTVTTRPTNTTLLADFQNPANNQNQLGGSALLIGGNVAGGIYIGGAPSGTVSGSTVDLTGDGVADGSEGTGAVTTYGSAPAMVIGSTRNIVIGPWVGLNGATQDNGYGFILRGSISASGLFDGVSATGLQIGVQGGGTTGLSSGLRIYGAISATSYNADATGIHMLGGVSGTNLNNSGSISASIAASTSVVTASAVNIEAGSIISSLTNTGNILAGATGDNSSAYAVRDQGGGIRNVLNEGVISAAISTTALGDAQTGSATALDLRKNTSGVTLVQQLNPNPNYSYGSVSGASTTAVTANTAATPAIIGDVYLGSGTNTVSLLAGSLLGALSFGSGTGGSLLIDNGSTLDGAFSFSGAGLAINVNNGVFNDRSASTVHVSTLNIGANSQLYFAVDPVNNATSKFVATGPVTIATGAKFGVTLLSIPSGPQSYVVIQSPSLTVGTTATATLSSVPYLLNATIAANPTAGTVNLTVQRKSAAQLGLNASEAALLDPALSAANLDSEVQKVLIAPVGETPFLKVFDQMLPDSSGAVFQAARAASDAVSRATAAQDQMPGSAGTKGYWVQQIVIGGHGMRTDQNIAYDVGGFGVVGGAAYGGSGLGAFGVTAAFSTLTTDNPDLKGDSQQSITTLEAGAYWQGAVGHLTMDARVGVGYDVINARRQFYALDANGNIAINRQVSDNRNGYQFTGHIGAGYELGVGAGFYVRPQAHLDYFQLNEDGFQENDPVGKGFALAVNSRTGSASSGVASLVFGRSWGADFRVRPELELGAIDTFSGDPGKTTARFLSGTSTFTLTPSDIAGVGGLARFGVKAATDFYEIGMSAGSEMRDHFYSGDVRLTVRLLF